MRIQKAVGRPPREIATALASATRGATAAAPRARRGRGARLRQPLPRAHVAARRAARDGCPGATASATAPRSPVAASTSSSCRRTPPVRCTRAVVAGSRSATRSRTCSRRRAPRCTASTTSTTPATSSTCSARRCTRGTAARSPPTTATRARTSWRWPTGMRAELGDDVTEEQAREWGYRDVVRADRARPRSHRRALRHVVLGADAARARRRRAGARRRSPSTGATFEEDGAVLAAGHGLRRPARPRAREVRRRDRRTSATTSRTTRTSSLAAGTTSSTSGVPTTTAR